MEVYDIGPTPHADHFLLTYLPKQKVIFIADHFFPTDSGSMPPRDPNIKRLVEAIKERGIDVKIIVFAHGSKVATYAQLLESYNKVI